MTWYDVVGILLVVVVAWLESKRGFGRAIFDLLGAIIALKLALFLAAPMGESVPLMGSAEANQAFWLAAVFGVLAVLIVVASKFVYETTLLSLDVLDPVVGGLLGLASGMAVAHIFLKTLLVSYGDAEVAKVLVGSFVGQELLEFRTYHYVFNALQNLGHW